ncbi:hypothetical protein N9N28_17685 [Rubripirellula amarantea]|nr:hypothetical protein [Rubripirellula amarantea]
MSIHPDSIDASDLPPGEAMLHCKCGYESAAFCFCDHAYGCTNCSAVVFPSPLPFVYAPPSCNQCGAALTTDDRILAGRMTSVDTARCPQCEADTLQLHSFPLQLLFSDLADSSPDIGQLIHARTMQPQRDGEPFCFFAPRLQINLALGITLTNLSRDSLPDGHHEFRTVGVDETNLVVDYVRPLPEDEWRWYIG